MIYLLHENSAQCAQMLDDESLDKQIEEIAQTLCNVCYLMNSNYLTGNNLVKAQSTIPLPDKVTSPEIASWASECRANYLYLVEMGLACCNEWTFRNNPSATYILSDGENEKTVIMQGLTIDKHKMQTVIEWAAENVPDLPKYVDLQLKVDDVVEDFTCPAEGIYRLYGKKPFPLCVPEKYRIYQVLNPENWSTIEYTISAYQKYYQDKLSKVKNAKWTSRETPEFLRGNLK